MEKLKQIINTVLTNRGKKPVSSIQQGTLLREDLGLDSLDLAELTVRIEAECDTDIFADGVVLTVGEVAAKIGE